MSTDVEMLRLIPSIDDHLVTIVRRLAEALGKRVSRVSDGMKGLSFAIRGSDSPVQHSQGTSRSLSDLSRGHSTVQQKQKSGTGR